MIKWLAECIGQIGPMDEIEPGTFMDAAKPVRRSIEDALAPGMDSFTGLKVIFFVEPSRGLAFRLAGPAREVNLARELLHPAFVDAPPETLN